MSNNGIMVVLEGVGGVGKSTLAKRLVEYYNDWPTGCIGLHVPGSTPVGNDIRTTQKFYRASGLMADATLAFLHIAGIAEAWATLVKPALERDYLVICDRWTLSTEVYQADITDLPLPTLRDVLRLATGKRVPDITLLCIAPSAQVLERRAGTPGYAEAHPEEEQGLNTLVERYKALCGHPGGYLARTGAFATVPTCSTPEEAELTAVESLAEYIPAIRKWELGRRQK